MNKKPDYMIQHAISGKVTVRLMQVLEEELGEMIEGRRSIDQFAAIIPLTEVLARMIAAAPKGAREKALQDVRRSMRTGVTVLGAQFDEVMAKQKADEANDR